MSTGTASVETIVADLGLEQANTEVGAYIGRQRWSGAQDSAARDVHFADAAVLVASPDVTVIFTVVRVTYEDSRTRSYALPLGLRPVGDALAERAPAFMITTLSEPGDGRILYDALGDPAYIHWLWAAIRERRTIATAAGELRCECPDPGRLEDTDTPWVRVLTVEQTNTSLEVGDGMFLKHLRRIEPGPSHELEMATALAAGGFTHIAPILADVMYGQGDRAPAPLVLMQPYLRNSSDGWALALTSLRDLYADAEESVATGRHDAEALVAGQGGAFVGEAGRLGTVIAEMHAALAASTGAGMRAEPLTRADLATLADAMTAELDALLATGSAPLRHLRESRDSICADFDALRIVQPGGLRTRVHGDLHLGQTLRVDSGWIILDFEGEPGRTPAERRALASPLRDVAGMLRSFDYAAAVALTERVMPESTDWEGLMAFGDEWARRNRAAFWDAYVTAVRGTPLLPPVDAALTLCRAFEVQKAVYEVRYELGHRPTWAAIPLRFLRRADAVRD